MNGKKDYCVKRAFESLHRAITDTNQIKERLNRLEKQGKENTRIAIEYDKTMKLLRLTEGSNRERKREKEGI